MEYAKVVPYFLKSSLTREDRVSVGYDGVGHSMQFEHILHEDATVAAF